MKNSRKEDISGNYDGNPWAGLASYQDPDASNSPLQFCGRDNESFDVARLIDDNILVTLYGKSGTGKTSLLNAGVFPRLRAKQYLPITIRLEMDAIGMSFQDCIIAKLAQTIQNKGFQISTFDVTSLPLNQQSQEYLWSYFARTHFVDSHGESVFPVLVLDQFEEVFRDRKSEAEALLRQIYYMMDDSHALTNRMINGQMYYYDFNYRFVLSIREDDLYNLEDSIDDNYLVAMKHCRYRLRSLSEDGAREAILIPGKGLFSPKEEEQIVETIIQTARNKDDGSISTNLLSLICSRIYLESRKAGKQRITAQLVDAYIAGNPFEAYYYEAASGLSNKEKSFIETHLIDSAGRRNSISETDFLSNVKNGQALLEGPHKILQRISIPSAPKNFRIELIHDSFCEPLSGLRQKRLLRRRRKIMLTSIGVAMLSIGILMIILYQKHRVDILNHSMLVNNARFVSNEVSRLTDEGDSYTARLLALEVLPPNRPYVIEAEAALRKTTYHNSAILRGHSKRIRSVEFSADGKQVISTSEDNSTIIWDADNGQMKSMKKSRSNLQNQTIATSFNGEWEAIVDPSDATQISLRHAKNTFNTITLEGHTGKINALCFSPDGKELASAADDNNIILWDVKTAKKLKTLKGHTNYVTCLAYSPNGKLLLSGSDDKTVRLWDILPNHMDRFTPTNENTILSACSFSPNGKRIVFTSFHNNLIIVRNTEDGKMLHSFEGHKNTLSVAFSPDSTLILTTSTDSTIKIWDIQKEILFQTLHGHKGNVISAVFSPNSKFIASGSQDKTIMIWDATSYKLRNTLKGHKGIIKSVAFNADGSMLVSASADKTIKIWDTNSGQCITTLSGHTDAVNSVAFHPINLQIVSTSNDNTIRVWDVKTGKSTKIFSGHHGIIKSAMFSTDGNYLISASYSDRLIKVWDVATGTLLCNLEGDKGMLLGIHINPQSNHIFGAYINGAYENWYFPTLQELMEETQKRYGDMELSTKQRKQYYLE